MEAAIDFSYISFGLIGVVFVIVLIRVRRKRSDDDEEVNYKQLPGPISLPFWGSSHIIGRYKKHCDAFSALRQQYGDIYGITLGSRRCVVISSMDLIREVLITKSLDFANRPDFLRFHAIFRGDRNFSIALCDWSEKQKTRRDLAFPFMHPRLKTLNGNTMNKIITSEVKRLVREFSAVNGEVTDPRPYLLFTTANIFFRYLCNKRFGEEDTNFRNVVQIYDVVFKALFQGFAIDFMPWLKVFNLKRLQELKDHAHTVSEVIAPIFTEHEQNLDPENPKDLVDILLIYLDKYEKPNTFSTLTREDAEVIVEDLLGGHSVLGNLWLWGLYILSDHPEVRKNIREEVWRVTDNTRAPTMEDKPSMPYTEATTMELLRCVASPIIPHVATRDTSIQDYGIAKDTMVMFNTYDMNMDPDLWAEPRKFMPERFITEEGHVFKPSHFIPFGTGKRTCLGDGLVRATLFLGLATLLQYCDIELPNDEPKPSLHEIPGIVVPQRDVRLIFRDLSKQSTRSSTNIIAMP